MKKLVRPWVIPFGKLADSVKGKKTPEKDIEKEKERIERMINVLEKERKEGIISASAYREMKKSLERKLKEVNKKSHD